MKTEDEVKEKIQEIGILRVAGLGQSANHPYADELAQAMNDALLWALGEKQALDIPIQAEIGETT